MRTRACLVIAALLVGGALSGPASAGSSFQTFVGYADSRYSDPLFPAGLCTQAFWNGQSGMSSTCTAMLTSGSFDGGAIMFTNNGTTNLSITGLSVTENPGSAPQSHNIWGALNFTLAPGQSAVFSQTGFGDDFDGSDWTVPGLNNISPTNNCSVGSLASTSLCRTNAPEIVLTVNGSAVTLWDTAHVLDTGGYNTVYSNPCIGGNNAQSMPGACTESLGWRLIGTTGLGDPTGAVPEPATLGLLALGLAGLGFRRRNR